ncbi:MAG: ABC transporter permease subunit [Lachnospiraceae bacterium]|nr:ABC transporter permease subunit [Lachnospiraceae bacterium]
MLTLLKHELKQNYKSLLIWTLSVGLIGFYCIYLFTSMTEDMQSLSESFSNMGAFSDAFGMSTLSIATIAGFFATEVGVVHSLGSSMFAAITATTVLSKEEDGHTGEFLFSLPISRVKVITAKLISVLVNLIIFTVTTALFYGIAFAVIGEKPDMGIFIEFMCMQFMMNVEIALICMAFSAFVKKNMLGAGLGIALLFYVYDLMGRVIPDLKDYLVIGPFSYANASELFAEKEISSVAYVFGICIIILSAVLAYVRYTKKDLAS